MSAPSRKSAGQHVLTVEATEWLGPHLVRVVLGGESLEAFPDTGCTDSYVKLIFVDPSLGHEPPYDLAALREALPPERRPVLRTYTVRRVDRAARRLAIDFVTHGDTGVAAPWAATAEPGDRLVISDPGGGYAPDPDVAWHVLAGDLSALPAISAAVEALPPAARGVVHLEIGDPADMVPLQTASSIEVRWLVNPDPTDTSFLARAVDPAGWPAEAHEPDGVQVFAHGERESVKAVRRVLRDVPRERLSISGYWARGRTEDVFQAEKREPIGRID
ncbi:siderophore-interacting protein [Blastococcus sp. CT_GayMR20]|uniref:siderophore-interacting protein n=1 Tax=Blastococcus sp. CT_GayMR20 TaxID=2559609 RepID=UPI001073BFEC|nr:siderophore-interacting protein [Blastococcus sp. CT_GayMR20]TFV68693.1 siderophore-interacting protein [Blastococcus sp. CT_GayMR20]